VGKVWPVKVRYTRRAVAQITKALDYVAERSPQGASQIRDRLEALVSLLQEQPFVGHATDRPGTRRLVTAPYPYLIDYRVNTDEIVVMRFRHAARRPRR
jgi:toxin ParE1/3/4